MFQVCCLFRCPQAMGLPFDAAHADESLSRPNKSIVSFRNVPSAVQVALVNVQHCLRKIRYFCQRCLNPSTLLMFLQLLGDQRPCCIKPTSFSPSSLEDAGTAACPCSIASKLREHRPFGLEPRYSSLKCLCLHSLPGAFLHRRLTGDATVHLHCRWG